MSQAARTIKVRAVNGRVNAKITDAARLCAPLYKMISRQFIFSGAGPIFAFIFPLLFLVMMGFILSDQRQSIIAGITSLSIMSLSIFAMPSVIADFKSSVLLKRIGATPIRPWMFVFVVITFYMALTSITTLWVLMWTAILWPSEAPGRFAQAEWGSFFFSYFMTLILSTNIGMCLASVARSANGVQTMAMFVSMSANFLGGQFIPLPLLAQNVVLSGLSHITPYRYTVSMFNQTWAGSSVFSGFGTDFYLPGSPVVLFPDYDRWLNLFLPIAFILICFSVSVKKFKWSNR